MVEERAAGHRPHRSVAKSSADTLAPRSVPVDLRREFHSARAVGGDGFERSSIASQVLEVERRRAGGRCEPGGSFLERHQLIASA